MKNPILVPTRYIALLVQLLEQQEYDCEDVLKATGIEPAHLRHNDAVLPTQQVVEAMRQLKALCGNRSGLGLEIGAMFSPGQLGDLGRALFSCPTLYDGLVLLTRCYEMVSAYFSMRMRRIGDIEELCWQPVRALPYDLLLMGFDLTLMSFHMRFKALMGERLSGYDAYFSTPAPSDAECYKAVRPGRCHFAQGGLPSLRIHIDADLLTGTPMPMANEADRQTFTQRVLMEVQARQLPRDWKAWVRMLLEEVQGEQPTQEDVAAIAGVSSSTLARHLAAQDCSFRELSLAIRHDRACRMLTDKGGMQVADVARVLGYHDAANFIRAFKSRAGLSPARYAEEAEEAEEADGADEASEADGC